MAFANLEIPLRLLLKKFCKTLVRTGEVCNFLIKRRTANVMPRKITWHACSNNVTYCDDQPVMMIVRNDRQEYKIIFTLNKFACLMGVLIWFCAKNERGESFHERLKWGRNSLWQVMWPQCCILLSIAFIVRRGNSYKPVISRSAHVREADLIANWIMICQCMKLSNYGTVHFICWIDVQF